MKAFSPTERSTLCPTCGGGTYTFGPRGPWCPNFGCSPLGGGRFVSSDAPITSQPIAPRAKRKVTRTLEPDWAPDTHDFVSKE